MKKGKKWYNEKVRSEPAGQWTDEAERRSITMEQELKQNVVAKICNVVMEETGRSADKIVIQSRF